MDQGLAEPGLAPVRGSEVLMSQAQRRPIGADPANPIVTASAKFGSPSVVAGVPENAPLGELLAILANSLYPSQREWAVDRLSALDWRSQPQIVESLLLAVRDDPAPPVRAACIRALVKMKASTTYVVQTLLTVKKTEKDGQVRNEADIALGVFLPGCAQATENKPAAVVKPN
jgi:hypothetical protein